MTMRASGVTVLLAIALLALEREWLRISGGPATGPRMRSTGVVLLPLVLAAAVIVAVRLSDLAE